MSERERERECVLVRDMKSKQEEMVWIKGREREGNETSDKGGRKGKKNGKGSIAMTAKCLDNIIFY